MRLVLVLVAAAPLLAACDELRPPPSPAEIARAQCLSGGLSPQSAAFNDCFTRTLSAVIAANAQMSSRPVFLPPPPQLAPPPPMVAPVGPLQGPRMVTCTPLLNGGVSCF